MRMKEAHDTKDSPEYHRFADGVRDARVTHGLHMHESA